MTIQNENEVIKNKGEIDWLVFFMKMATITMINLLYSNDM